MKTFSVQELKTHLNGGTSDEVLMHAYGLSREELKGLYDQLIKALAAGTPYVHLRQDEN
jgi:hypothetical protein